MTTIGACVISRNDNYGGDLSHKISYCLNSFIKACDEVYYIDWNSPTKSLINEVRLTDGIKAIEEVHESLIHRGNLHIITITPDMARKLTKDDPEVQNCVEVLARNIGIRRLATDYIISTNSDILCGSRENILNGIKDEHTFHTIARRNIDFKEVRNKLSGSRELSEWIENNAHKYGQFGDGSPLGPRDKWSLISCPGDFQLAHRDVWYGIKGFEESLVYRGYTDSNVQRKADYYGFKQALVRDIVALHFNHYPGSGSTGGNSAKWNTDECLFNFQGTTNPENWGFADINFEEEII